MVSMSPAISTFQKKSSRGVPTESPQASNREHATYCLADCIVQLNANDDLWE